MTTQSNDLQDKLQFLHNFSACDVSDALLKLQKLPSGQVARAGHLADIAPFASFSFNRSEHANTQKVIAPASTLKLVPKAAVPEEKPATENTVPKASHWVDMTEAGTIVVIEQPPGQKCAAVGGIMAQRMKVRQVAGCVVGGRVRDFAELRDSGLAIYAQGRSTVGTNAESVVYARNVPVSITGVSVVPGDIVFLDPNEGAVVIPQQLLDETISLMPTLVAADDKVKEAVVQGLTVAEAFKKFRG
ncbi:hypothetical protein B0A52_00380 [Exophiala mesophila]|uniref:DlpA domain-containing protein n=1 Tax=Exophiala mesophila TaxID=212818 RepID=A0A438NJW9_EXOME|nr:hypothetical protein B0A52_00380 [Exophiala mesophila]